MGSIIKKKKGKQIYYYWVESARVNGQPRIVSQKYLGRGEDIVQAIEGKKGLDTPKHSIVQEFGNVMALYDLASRLGVIELIDSVAPKRDQGLSIGQYMLLAAINRAVDPKSKNKIAEWYEKTALHQVIPAQAQMLSSQRFWDNMHLLSEEAIRRFEDTFTQQIVEKYDLSTDCLIYDTTNFFTYIDTNTASALAKRGHSKEKRTDLKIVGLSMMVSPDFNIPLFHETYPGNDQDVKTFSKTIEQLKQRYLKITGASKPVTLVFDKGNNSPENIQLLRSGTQPFRIVGSLRLNQVSDLLLVQKEKFTPLPDKLEERVTVYRTTYRVYEGEFTVLIVYNPALLQGQLQGVHDNIEKCAQQLKDLQHTLHEREIGQITKGRKPTADSVQKRVDTLLQKEFMKDLFVTTVVKTTKSVQLDFSVRVAAYHELREERLGKTILFTDNHEWASEKIVSAYRSQYHIEHTFRQMKNTDHLGMRPLHHWTDQKIKVHAFYCVLALRLCGLLQKELHQQGIELSVNRMLDLLSDIKQVITVYPKEGESKKDRQVFSLSKPAPEVKKIMEALNIAPYQTKK